MEHPFLMFLDHTQRRSTVGRTPGVDGRIILKWVFMKWDGGHGLFPSCSERGQVVGTCECGNELSGSIKCGEFLDY